jgi:hypothetical protein
VFSASELLQFCFFATIALREGEVMKTGGMKMEKMCSSFREHSSVLLSSSQDRRKL